MTDLLEKAVTAARGLSPEMQDDIARMVLAVVGDDPAVYRLTPEEETDLEESNAEVARGDFVTDDEMRAIWAKHAR